MSLILEALRKSEAERRRGASPDLLTPVVNVAPTATRAWPRWAMPAGVAAALLVALGGAALWRMRDAPAPVTPVTTTPAQASADTARQSPAPAPARTPRPAATTTAIAIPPPAAPPAPATTQPAPAAGDAVVAAETPAAGQPTPPPMPASPATVSPPPPITASPAAPVSSEFISPQATIRLADLSPEERSQLPALKVSMHMWAPAAADRFVIIDGTRLAEGDRVADATIQAIQADGVTLAWRGRQIRLPIR